MPYVVSWHLSLESYCFQHASCRDIIREAPKDLCCALDGKLLMDPAARHDKFYHFFYLMVDVLFEHCSNVDTLDKFCKGGMNPAKSVVFPN